MLLFGGDDLHGNMPRRQIILQAVEQRQPSISGRLMSSVIAVDVDTSGPLQAPAPCGGNDDFKALLVPNIQQHTGEVRVILNDHQHRIGGLDGMRVILGLIAGVARHFDIRLQR